jgi:hypothetical protein
MPDLTNLTPDVYDLGRTFASGLATIFGLKLYGIYLYGAAVFHDGGPGGDFDAHVILTGAPSATEREGIADLYCRLAVAFPPLGTDIDAYFILLAAAHEAVPPHHLLDPAICDQAWPLHCAHVRAGRVVTLYGPDPVDIFPQPEWPAIVLALDHELDFVRASLEYPAYCILNLCRILYSFRTGEVVVSKRFSGRWAADLFPEWAPVIAAAQRYYDGAAVEADVTIMTAEMDRFLACIEDQIRAAREDSRRFG